MIFKFKPRCSRIDLFQNPHSQPANQALISRTASEICGTHQYAGLKSASMHQSCQGGSLEPAVPTGELLTITPVKEQPT